ncbi:MAG: periplasmic osmoprotectant binding protein [Synergistales bacterium 54_9]|nr:MAG: periplasmic osmoprotectant binding protein [Synergistales bacterium 54_9]MDK2845601.1 osmoprotectant transport system substrate-binding protein [Synergistales bacterium]MDN5336056.1 osmoprotectant transport system substrate-binding protein [Synergistales bacterium]
MKGVPGMKRSLKNRCLTLVSILVIFAVFTVGIPQAGAAQDSIRVASKIDTEGSLLGQVIVLLLEGQGFAVEDKTALGATNVVRQAIIAGEIDIYPEYTGNGYYFFEGTDPEIWKDAKKAYETVASLDMEKNGIVWLRPAPANNTWAIAARRDLAEKENIRTLEDFADYVNRGGKVKLACSEEFASRPDVLPAFEKAYGFHLEKDQLLILSGGNTAQTEQAASLGTDGVNFAMAYGTDGGISVLDLVVLEDSMGVQPVYEPAPIVRKAVLESHPEIREILEPAFAGLDMENLQRLNGKIAVEGLDPRMVAREYLRDQGLIN